MMLDKFEIKIEKRMAPVCVRVKAAVAGGLKMLAERTFGKFGVMRVDVESMCVCVWVHFCSSADRSVLKYEFASPM